MSYTKTVTTMNEVKVFEYRKGIKMSNALITDMSDRLFSLQHKTKKSQFEFFEMLRLATFLHKFSHYKEVEKVNRAYTLAKNKDIMDLYEMWLTGTATREYFIRYVTDTFDIPNPIAYCENVLAERLISRERNANAKKNKFLELVDSNFKTNDKNNNFITFTFDPKKVPKGTQFDLVKTNKIFNNFIQWKLKPFIRANARARNKKNIGHGNERDFKYFTVWERHKSGAIHYHLITNLKSCMTVYKNISYDLSLLWKVGYIKLKPIHHNVSVAGYLAKYLTKDFDESVKYKRRFWSSKNILRPAIAYFNMSFRDFKKQFLEKNNIRSKLFRDITFKNDVVDISFSKWVFNIKSFSSTELYDLSGSSSRLFKKLLL